MANQHTRVSPQISDPQRQELNRWLRRQKTSQALALRARIKSVLGRRLTVTRS